MLKLDTTVLRDSERSSNFCKLVAEKYEDEALDIYTRLSQAMAVAAKGNLPMHPKAQPGWFISEEKKLSSLVEV